MKNWKPSSFSGKEPTEEQRMQMQEHAKSCEACRALLNSAELLGGMREIDDDVELPESFTAGWRQAVRAQSRQPIRFEEQVKKRRARPAITRILSYCGVRGGAGVGHQLGQIERRRALHVGISEL